MMRTGDLHNHQVAGSVRRRAGQLRKRDLRMEGSVTRHCAWRHTTQDCASPGVWVGSSVRGPAAWGSGEVGGPYRALGPEAREEFLAYDASGMLRGADDRSIVMAFFFFFQAEDGIRDLIVTGVQTCALPISGSGWGCARHRGFPRLVRPSRRDAGPPICL